MIALFLLLLLAIAPATATDTSTGRFASALRGLAPQQKNVGLLVGIYNEDGYQTLLFEYNGKAIEPVASVPLLAVPDGKKFAYLYRRTYTSAEITEDDIEGGKVLYKEQWEELVVERDRAKAEREAELSLSDEPAVPPPCNDCRNWDWEDHIDLRYVIPGHATISVYGDGYTGGVHPNRYANTYTVHLLSIAPRTINSISRDTATQEHLVESQIAELYPVAHDPGIMERMQHELLIRGRLEYFIDGQGSDSLYEAYDSTDYIGVAPESIDGIYDVDTSNISYVLERTRGRVFLRARADAAAGYAESGDYALTAEYNCGVLDTAVYPHSNFPLHYNAFVKADSTVRDVMVAPTRNIVYVLADDTLLGVDVATQKVVFEYLLPEASSVVMVEWATGAELDLWKAVLK